VARGRLEGVRVLDFSWTRPGRTTCLLALLGADVVSRVIGAIPRGGLADYGRINRSPNFPGSTSKRSFQVDLSQPDGLDLVHRLVDWADVVVDNFRPGVMSRFGLGAPTLLERRPDLLVVASSANGSTGPESRAAGLASIFGATGGLSEQTGYVDGPPTEIGESTDYRSGNALAVAILAGLLHRAKTGHGQFIDLARGRHRRSPDALLAHQLGVEWDIRIGNAHREMFPHDVYAAAADDHWVAVAVDEDDEWAALCGVLGREEWVRAYATPKARRAAGDVIDDAISAWTRRRSSREAFETLQAAGVPRWRS
jgi:crotonobetainyl-CoA:carnitine CoA-transferase CaiB-like acyl-CoA transferase